MSCPLLFLTTQSKDARTAGPSKLPVMDARDCSCVRRGDAFLSSHQEADGPSSPPRSETTLRMPLVGPNDCKVLLDHVVRALNLLCIQALVFALHLCGWKSQLVPIAVLMAISGRRRRGPCLFTCRTWRSIPNSFGTWPVSSSSAAACR